MDAATEALIRRMTTLNPNQRPTVGEMLTDQAFAEFAGKANTADRLLHGEDLDAEFFVC
jgi:hypothetical protein